MTRLLFWNVNKRATEVEIATVACELMADIVAIAEAAHVNTSVLNYELCTRSLRSWERLETSFRIGVYTALQRSSVRALSEDQRTVFLTVRQIVGPEFILGLVHLASKMSGDPSMLAIRLRQSVEKVERNAGHSRTILMGDFNMEPYDAGLLSSEAMHATMCREIASRGSRVVDGEERQFFYNPMWNLLGDAPPGPPGTYFLKQPRHGGAHWAMIDQVLVRPEAINLVDLSSIAIITKVRSLSLKTQKGRPAVSDHFPLLLETRSVP